MVCSSRYDDSPCLLYLPISLHNTIIMVGPLPRTEPRVLIPSAQHPEDIAKLLKDLNDTANRLEQVVCLVHSFPMQAY